MILDYTPEGDGIKQALATVLSRYKKQSTDKRVMATAPMGGSRITYVPGYYILSSTIESKRNDYINGYIPIADEISESEFSQSLLRTAVNCSSSSEILNGEFNSLAEQFKCYYFWCLLNDKPKVYHLRVVNSYEGIEPALVAEKNGSLAFRANSLCAEAIEREIIALMLLENERKARLFDNYIDDRNQGEKGIVKSGLTGAAIGGVTGSIVPGLGTFLGGFLGFSGGLVKGLYDGIVIDKYPSSVSPSEIEKGMYDSEIRKLALPSEKNQLALQNWCDYKPRRTLNSSKEM